MGWPLARNVGVHAGDVQVALATELARYSFGVISDFIREDTLSFEANDIVAISNGTFK